MANPEHIEIVRNGKDAITAWYQSCHDHGSKIRDPVLRLNGADLEGIDLEAASLGDADLRTANLRGANLWRADLNAAMIRGADLEGANLTATDLRNADLAYANLRNARIERADLSWINLNRADLSQTTLRRSKLWGAILVHTRLNDANLQKCEFSLAVLDEPVISNTDFGSAEFNNTTFGKVDLSLAIGLDSAKHSGPSSLSLQTLYLSKGTIPAVFLKGCGFSNDEIEFFSKRTTGREAMKFYSCFISYSSEDDTFVRYLVQRMESDGLEVWYAPRSIRGGAAVMEQIDRAIDRYEKLLLVLSPHSMNSEWVRTEVMFTMDLEKRYGFQRLFPIRICPIEDVKTWKLYDSDSGRDVAKEVRKYHIPDFSGWQEEAKFDQSYDDLLRDLTQR